jgi:hypothetical protein
MPGQKQKLTPFQEWANDLKRKKTLKQMPAWLTTPEGAATRISTQESYGMLPEKVPYPGSTLATADSA